MGKIVHTFLITLGLITFSITGFAQQIGMDDVNEKDVQPWITESQKDYFGVYHFGYSEVESDLVLFEAGGIIYGQIRSGDWNDDATGWVWNYENIGEISIEGSQFYSDKTNGAFVIYKNEFKGLKIVDSWSGNVPEGSYEIGVKTSQVSSYFSGEYSEISMYEITKDDLKGLDNTDLQIMRNEIFARYGYRFKKGGKMANHFSKKDWYQPQHDRVRQFFTGLEKKNLMIIMEMEEELRQ